MKVLFVTFFIVIVDQVTKLLVKGFSIPSLNIEYQGMYHGQRIEVLGDFFRLTFIENPGMAFGFDPGIGLKFYLSLFSLIASIGLIFYLYHIRKEHFSTRLSLAVILGGAIGNLIDRMFYGVFFSYAPLFYGKVVDFLDFDFFNITIFGRNYDRFPIFNIADSAVTIGVVLLLIFYNKYRADEKVTQDQPDAQELNDAAAQANNTDTAVYGSTTPDEDTSAEERTQDNDEPDNGKEIPL